MEHVEVRATKGSAVLLCLYEVMTSLDGVVAHVESEGSLLGIAMAAMPGKR